MATPFTTPSLSPEPTSTGPDRSRFLAAIGFGRSPQSTPLAATGPAGLHTSPPPQIFESASKAGAEPERKTEPALAVLEAPEPASQNRVSAPMMPIGDSRPTVTPFLPLDSANDGPDSLDLLDLLGLDDPSDSAAEGGRTTQDENAEENVALSGDVGPDFLASTLQSADPLESDWLLEFTKDEAPAAEPEKAAETAQPEPSIPRGATAAMPWLSPKRQTPVTPVAEPIRLAEVAPPDPVIPAPVVEAEIVSTTEKIPDESDVAGAASPVMAGSTFSFAGLRDRISQPPPEIAKPVAPEPVSFHWQPTGIAADEIPSAIQESSPSPSEAKFAWSKPDSPAIDRASKEPETPVSGFQWSPPLASTAPGSTGFGDAVSDSIPAPVVVALDGGTSKSSKPAFIWEAPDAATGKTELGSSGEFIDEEALLFTDDEVVPPGKGFGETLGSLAAGGPSLELPKANGTTPSDIVDVSCPQCAKGLSLRQEHLGISGNCVWCGTPIVATANGAGTVSVLVLGGVGLNAGARVADIPGSPVATAREEKAFDWVSNGGPAISTESVPAASGNRSAFEYSAPVAAPQAPGKAFSSAFSLSAPKSSTPDLGPAFKKLSEFLDPSAETATSASGSGKGAFGLGIGADLASRELAARSLFSTSGPIAVPLSASPEGENANSKENKDIIETGAEPEKQGTPAAIEGESKTKRRRGKKAPEIQGATSPTATWPRHGDLGRKIFWTVSLLGLAAGIGISAYFWKSLEVRVWPSIEPLVKNALSFTRAVSGTPQSGSPEMDSPPATSAADSPVSPEKTPAQAPAIPQAVVPPRPAFNSEPLKFNDEALQEPTSSK